MNFGVNELELLRATNHIASRWGGRHVGTVGGIEAAYQEPGKAYACQTYRNNWLIDVNLTDRKGDPARVAPGDHEWEIGLGFCQTNITRAPDGGFRLMIPAEILCMAYSADNVVKLFGTMLGKTDERQDKLDGWLEDATQYWQRQDTQPIVVDLNAYVRDYAVIYSDAMDMIRR